ncbi:MAG: hypothetical protein RQ757_09225, partial [Pseudomonadales bacterium]|nr:hypothetical protein [Pseudomonadales bacterium]
FMVDAIVAHEEIHGVLFKNEMDVGYSDFRMAIENLSLPLSEASDPTEAIIEMSADIDLLKMELGDWQTEIAWNTASHLSAPASVFIQAQHTVTDPMVNFINQRMSGLSCP